jgi:hypothetical protein
VITRIEAYKYRCFEKLNVRVEPYNVIAGANGSGKTTLLDLPGLFGEMLTRRSCKDAFLESARAGISPRARVLREIVYRERGDHFTLALEARIPTEVQRLLVDALPPGRQENSDLWPSHLRYEVAFQIFSDAELHIASEYLLSFPEKHRLPDGDGLIGERVGRRSEPARSMHVIVRRDAGESAEFRPEITGDSPSARSKPRTRAKPMAFSILPTQLALANVPGDMRQFPCAAWFRSLLSDRTVFYEPNGKQLRQPSPPGLSKRPLPDASNLPWLALDLKTKDPERFADWLLLVQAALSQVEAIDAFEHEGDHRAYLTLTYRGGHRVTSAGLSDGTLRILAFTILPFLSLEPGILVAEEPENGLHPRAIEAVLQALEALYDTQVWVSTHSPLVLARAKLDHVLCARIGDGGAVEIVPAAEHPRLVDWKRDIDLGSLFAAGVLG